MHLIIIIITSVLICCLAGNASRAATFSDQPWDQQELDQRLNENLVLNGDLSQRFSSTARYEPVDVAPCWKQIINPLALRMDDKSLVIDNEGLAILGIRAVQYYFRGDEPSYKVAVRGNFTPSSQIKLTAEFCGDDCRSQAIQMTKVGENLFQGSMQPGETGEYVRRFNIAIGGGVRSVDSFIVSNVDQPSLASIKERDSLTMRICYEEVPPILGGVRALDIFAIFLANIISVGLIIFLFYKKNYFPIFLVLAFYITNIFGLLPLYFGFSDARILQNVVDRSILSNLAWAGTIMLCFAAVGYGVIAWIGKNIWVEFRMRVEVNSGLSFVIFLLIASVIIFALLPGSIEYYNALIGSESLGASARAAFIRSSINEETFGLKSHYFRLIFLLLPMVLSMVIISLALDKRKYWFIPLLVVMQIAILLYNGEKAPVAWFIFGLSFIFISKSHLRKKILWPALFGAGALFIIIFVGPRSISLMADRMIFGGITVGYYVLKLFPDQSPFISGLSVNLPFIGHGAATYNLDLFLWRNIFPELFFSHITGTATGAIWTQGYANFGWLGACMFSLAFGGITAGVYTIVNRVFVQYVATGMCGYLVFHYASLGESNFDRFLFDFYVLGILAIMLVLALLSYLLGLIASSSASLGTKK